MERNFLSNNWKCADFKKYVNTKKKQLCSSKKI